MLFVWFGVFFLPFLVFFHSEPMPAFVEQAIAATLVVTLLVLTLRVTKEKVFFYSPVFLFWLLWGAALFLSITLNNYPLTAIWKGYFYAWLLAGVALFSFVQLMGAYGREILIDHAAWGLCLSGLLAGGVGMFQFYGILSEMFFWVPEPQARFIGVFSQANSAGVFSVLAMAALLYLLIRKKINNWIAVPIASLMGFVILASGSKTAWLSLAFVLLTLALVVFLRRSNVSVESRGRVLFAALACLAMFPIGPSLDGVLVSTVENYSVIERPVIGEMLEQRVDLSQRESRLDLWEDSLQLAIDNWVVGVGPGRFASEYADKYISRGEPAPVLGNVKNAHNLFLMVFSEFGVLGLALVLLVACSALCFYLRREFGYGEAFILMALGVIFLHSLTEYPLWYFHFLLIFLALIVLVFPVKKKEQNIFGSAVSVTLLIIPVFLGLLFAYSATMAKMVSISYSLGDRDPQMDFVSLSISESDGYLGPQASILKYRIYPLAGLNNPYELARASLMRDVMPVKSVLTRNALIASELERSDACELIEKSTTFYPDTRGYFSYYFNFNRDESKSEKYSKCVNSLDKNDI